MTTNSHHGGSTMNRRTIGRAALVAVTAAGLALTTAAAATGPTVRANPPRAITAPARAATAAPPALGFALGGVEPYQSTARQAANLRLVHGLHSRDVRIDLPFADLQPVRGGPYRWAAYDRYLTRLRGGGYRTLIILGTTPAWARPARQTGAAYVHAPTTATTTRGYCYTVAAHVLARRYAGAGTAYFEIGNEVNLRRPGVDPSFHTWRTRWWTPCTAGIRAASAATHRPARAVAGSIQQSWHRPGVDGDTTQWLRVASTDRTFRPTDIAIHPYTGGLLPSRAVHWTRLIAAAERYMPRSRLWVTEFGQDVYGADTAAKNARQAAVIGEALRLWSDPAKRARRGPFFLYSIRDGNGPASQITRCGLTDLSGRARPAYRVAAAYGATAAKAAGR